MSSNAVHTAIARLFARGSAIPNAQTLASYESCLASFGSEFAPADSRERQGYADSLVAAGLLERRFAALPFGFRAEYRQVDPQAVPA